MSRPSVRRQPVRKTRRLTKMQRYRLGGWYRPEIVAHDHDRPHTGLNKRLKEVLPDGRRVMYVDGSYIRNNANRARTPAGRAYRRDFRLGGNPSVYPGLVPKGEEWVEDPRNPVSRQLYKVMEATPVGVAIHETREDTKMRYERLGYYPNPKNGRPGAHASASRLEEAYENHKIGKNKAIQLAIKHPVRTHF